MNNVPIPENEAKRLEILQSYRVLDTEPEKEFDDIAQLAADICGVETALISFIDEKRQWQKSKIKLDVTPVSRDDSLCAHTLVQRGISVIEDTTKSTHLADNPLVTGEPYIRFYAGVPLIVEQDAAIGTLCVMGTAPQTLSEKQIRGLKTLANQVVLLLKQRKKTQIKDNTRALEENQAFLDLVLDNLPARIFWKDTNGKYLGVNTSFAGDAGLSKGDVVGKTDFELPWAEEQAEAFTADDRQVRDSGQAKLNIIEPINTATGEQLWLETNKIPLRNASGEIVGILGTYQDVTERLRLQEELEENQAFLDLVLDSLPARIFWKDTNGKYLGVNTNFAGDAGLSKDGVVGKTDFELPWADEQAEAFTADDRQVRESGQAKLNIIEPIDTATGEQLWLETNKVPLRDTSGQIVGILGTYQDVTERLRFQKELEANQIFLDLVLDSLPARIFWKDTNGKYLGVNTNFAADAGLTKEQMLGKTDFDMPWAGEQAEAFTADDRQVRESGQAKLNIIEPLDTATGEQLWLETNKVPLRDASDETIGILGTYQDVTERIKVNQQVKQQAQELERSQEFLQLVIDSLPISIFWKDNESRFLGVNNRFAESLGIPIDEIIGKTEHDLPIPKEEADIYVAADTRVVQNEVSETGVIQQQLNTESDTWLEISRFPIRAGDNQVVGVLGTIDNVTERVQSEQLLSKRAAELEILTDLSRAVTSTEALDTFLPQAVNFIKDRFNLYHAHIYLTNELQDAVILSAGAGEAGEAMVREGRRIALDNPNSLVARSARTKEGVIEDDLQLAPTYLPNPLLPDSRASMAIPMIVGDGVIGVLNVQADQANYFTDEDIRIQRTLAEQIALAIQNERNRQRTAEALQELNTITRRQTGEGWEQYLKRAESNPDQLEYGFDGDRVATEAVTADDMNAAFTQHISVYDEAIGELELGVEDIDEETGEIISLITERLGQHLDNLRLAEQSQLRAAELQAVNQFAEAISGQLDQSELLHLIFTEVKKLYDFDAFTISEITRDDIIVSLIAHESGHFFTDIPNGQLADSKYTKTVLRGREALLIQDDQFNPGQVQGLQDEDHTKSMIFLPIIVGQDRFVMSLQSYEYGRYTDADIPLLNGITNYVGVALQNASLFEETNQRAEQERLVNEITLKIQGTVTIEAALQTAIEELGQVFQAEYTEVKLNPEV